MNFNSQRFGDNLTIDAKDLIEFPNGLIGFPEEKRFVLLRPRSDSPVAWLHSVTNSALAFPVMSLAALTLEYPEAEMLVASEAAGIGGTLEALSVMLVFAAPGRGIAPTVNLVAPIIVSAETRMGAQILVEGTRLSACEPLSTWLRPPATSGANSPAANARTRRTNEVQMAADEP